MIWGFHLSNTAPKVSNFDIFIFRARSCLVLMYPPQIPQGSTRGASEALGPLYGLGEAQSCALKMSRVAASAAGAGRLFQFCTVLTAVALHSGEFVSLADNGFSFLGCFSTPLTFLCFLLLNVSFSLSLESTMVSSMAIRHSLIHH